MKCWSNMMKLQFSDFITEILTPYLTIFQTNRPVVSFMCDELIKMLDQLLLLIFRRNALEEVDTTLKKLKKIKIKKKWLTDESHHLEDGLVDFWRCNKESVGKNPPQVNIVL